MYISPGQLFSAARHRHAACLRPMAPRRVLCAIAIFVLNSGGGFGAHASGKRLANSILNPFSLCGLASFHRSFGGLVEVFLDTRLTNQRVFRLFAISMGLLRRRPSPLANSPPFCHSRFPARRLLMIMQTHTTLDREASDKTACSSIFVAAVVRHA